MTRQTSKTQKSRISIKGIKFYLLSGLCGILAVVSIFMTIESGTNGGEIASLQKQESQLLAQQQELQQQLVQSLSTESLQEKSSELGFVKVGNLVYVTSEPSVARLNVTEVER